MSKKKKKKKRKKKTIRGTFGVHLRSKFNIGEDIDEKEHVAATVRELQYHIVSATLEGEMTWFLEMKK